MKTWLKSIKKMGACEDALNWGEQYETIDKAWAECERGDWMLWLLGKQSGEPGSESRKMLALAACQCARLVLPYVKEGELRPLKAIEATEAWARNERGVSLKDVRDAANAANDAYAASAAKKSTLKQCADIVRLNYKSPTFKK